MRDVGPFHYRIVERAGPKSTTGAPTRYVGFDCAAGFLLRGL
jgi:hypothetical protein